MNNSFYKKLENHISEIITKLIFIRPKIIKLYKNNNLNIKKKPDSSPVTEVDLLINNYLISFLEKYNYPILSEESKITNKTNSSKYLWIIDPLDGTKDFIQKTDEFSIIIALTYENNPILGLIYLPVENKFYWSIKSKGSYKQIGNSKPKRIIVSSRKKLESARTIISKNHFSLKMKKALKDINLNKVIHCGSNGVKLGRLAEGNAELFFNTTDYLGKWDLCAPSIIIKEAGGKITDLYGKNLVFNKKENIMKNGVIATNSFLHDSITNYFLKKRKND